MRRGPKTAPANKLSNQECQRVLDLCCNSEFKDKTPWEMVPTLADRGIFVASESTFYRVLRREKLLAHRLSSNPPKHEKPKELIALAPNQVWTWDITYLRSPVLGMFYYLYMVIDIYSRKIIDWEIEDFESSETAARMMSRASFRENIEPAQLFIHSDNGGPMKGATMIATLKKL